LSPTSVLREAASGSSGISRRCERSWGYLWSHCCGIAVAFLALGLLDLIGLIGLITHLAYTGTFSTSLAPPDTSALGPLSVFVPVVGGLIVGVMARVGSERIRGHGIPEAMETILLRGSRMEPRLAVLKPISSAVSIGTVARSARRDRSSSLAERPAASPVSCFISPQRSGDAYWSPAPRLA
jgi:hypothetical protein